MRDQLLRSVEKLGLKNCVVVSPDIGSIKLARAFAEKLRSDLAIVDKRRVNANHVEVNALIGDVEGRDVLLVDDMCSTGGTLKIASRVCKNAGAKAICAAVTHGLLLGKRLRKVRLRRC